MSTFIAGQYTATYDANTVGQIEAGIVLEHVFFKRLITGDNMAEAPQDAVFRGAAQFAQFTLLEYTVAGARPAFYPYGSAWMTMDTVIGTLDYNAGASNNAKALVLTALAGTPAAASPASVTMAEAILAEGFPVGLLMAPDLRTIPIRMRIYPNTSFVFGTLT